MHFGRFLHIRVVTAEPERFLSRLTNENIDLGEICFQDLLTVDFSVRRSQFVLMEKILKQSEITYKVINKEGVWWRIEGLKKRAVLLLGLLLFAVSALYIPGRIFFVETSGNEQIPGNQILSAAERFGIRFGAKASAVRSEELKNQLLSSIPQLQWIGVEVQGTRAIIQVKERSTLEKIIRPHFSVSSIVAAKDGVITKMTVESGTPLFQVGQSVKENEVIVSGYTDCGIKVLAENAKAEVFAHTMHEKTFIMPIDFIGRWRSETEKICYKLRIGKKVINLCNHSGISDATCVKMYSENYLTLPGNFRLPVSVIRIDHVFHEMINKASNLGVSSLDEYARFYIRQQMVAGEILSEDIHLEQHDDFCILMGTYSCNEMIGQVKYEEILE